MPDIRKRINNVKSDITWWYDMSMCVYNSPCVYTCRCTPSACVWPSKERGTKMTATLHLLWGLSPTCLCTSPKLSHCCFSSLLQSPSCFSQLIRKFHSCLSPLLPACPCALGVSVSRPRSLYGALLLYCLSQTPLPPLISLPLTLILATNTFCLFHTSVQDRFSCETADFSEEHWVFMLNWTDYPWNLAFCLWTLWKEWKELAVRTFAPILYNGLPGTPVPALGEGCSS